MKKSFQKILEGYQAFREKYASTDQSIMQALSDNGQQPKYMVVACCDSRVDPAVILQCDPGDLFVVRNVANIIPPYVKDEDNHGTSAALEFGIRVLEIKHLIILGHSQCGGIQTLLNQNYLPNDFITNWVSLIKTDIKTDNADHYAKKALHQSRKNCESYPWIKERLMQNQVEIHLWFFDIKAGEIFTYVEEQLEYIPLLSAKHKF